MPFRSTTSYHKNCKQLSLFWSRPTSVQAGRSNPSVKETWQDPNDLKNFRFVSNLPFISKILEKVEISVGKRSAWNQTVYIQKKNHSTETALLSVVGGLVRNSDDRLVSVLALLDLIAAFDTLDHPIACCYRRLRPLSAFLALCFTGLHPT